MIKMLRFTWWQVRLLAKYQILTIALIIAVIYLLVLYFFKILHDDLVTSLFVFLDPTAIGFIFIGAIILFEKGDNTLDAQIITPMETRHYLWSKAIALLLPAIVCSSGIVFAAHGFDFNYFSFYISLILTSLIFTFLGIAGVIRVKTFNQYMVLIPLFTAPTSLPLLNFLGLTDWKWLYLIPTQSTLDLFIFSLGRNHYRIELFDIAYLGLWTWLSYYFARKSFEKKMYK
jgi:fluoroquinolone transport system permease protein